MLTTARGFLFIYFVLYFLLFPVEGIFLAVLRLELLLKLQYEIEHSVNP